jgi:hypothetical protein
MSVVGDGLVLDSVEGSGAEIKHLFDGVSTVSAPGSTVSHRRSMYRRSKEETMSALAIPAVPVPQVPARRRGHLELVGPGYVAPHRPATPVPAERPAVRLTARGRLVRSLLVLTTALTVAVTGAGWLGGLAAGAQGYEGPVERVSVQAGDTVWGIAAATAADGQDLREVVDDILALNGLASGDILVGQQLVVPAG